VSMCDACRTFNPDEADFFYVPQYSSCYPFPIMGALRWARTQLPWLCTHQILCGGLLPATAELAHGCLGACSTDHQLPTLIHTQWLAYLPSANWSPCRVVLGVMGHHHTTGVPVQQLHGTVPQQGVSVSAHSVLTTIPPRFVPLRRLGRLPMVQCARQWWVLSRAG
jgi:hypothetical protein